ncbi:MAG TPA: adenine phosphoribosyltransferase [Xanthomonadaceae bacterium]|nr:adenine phosphoribosyltransferase [Xanthomonadaceae bacterium]
MNLRDYVRDVADFPEAGIVFRDVMPLLADPVAFSHALEQLAHAVPPGGADRIAAIEARGFVFGAALATRLRIGLVPIRKPGKLPAPVVGIDYALEYGRDRLELPREVMRPGLRVLLVDDVLATGGTLAAAARLIRLCGCEPVAAGVLIELEALGGRGALEGLRVHAVLRY